VKGKLGWRAILIAMVLLVSIVYLVPTVVGDTPVWWGNILPSDQVQLGLDLQGGMHLVLEVQTDKAVESQLDIMANDLRRTLRDDRVWVTQTQVLGKHAVLMTLKDGNDLEKLESVLEDRYPDLIVKKSEPVHDGLQVVLELTETERKRIKQFAVSQALETIRNRVDQFGVSEPDIRPQGADRLLIQLPGVREPERALALIGRTAQLEFKLVDETADIQKALEGELPPGRELLHEVRVDRETGRRSRTPMVVESRSLLTGQYVTDARVQIDSQFNEPYVALTLNPKGARLFERITEENVRRRLAIVLDDVINSAPVIQEKIPGGTARITGNFTMEEARDLAIVLRAGALPAPVIVLEERTVGPSLGKDSVRKGFLSMLVGGCIVLLFMLLYYRVGGVVADAVLLFNVVLIMAALAAFGATLTLPGIAGIILTIGMAVDANVLVFERIREELRVGKTPKAALDGGYAKAIVTILDANVTTLIVALVLFQFGTGPIRGFAVTLSIGILASLFTAVFVSRFVFDYMLIKLRLKQIPI